jgi:spermidine synthase
VGLRARRRRAQLRAARPAAAGLRYLTLGELGALFRFAPDMAEVPAAPNRLNDQALVRTYEAEWGRINR